MYKPLFTCDITTSQIAKYEPIATICEFVTLITNVKGLIKQYEWDSDLPGVHDAPDPTMFTRGVPSNIDLMPSGPLYTVDSGSERMMLSDARTVQTYRTTCTNRFTVSVGNTIATGMCFVYDIIYTNGLMPWFQVFVDIGAVFAFVIYLYKKWIDMANK